MSQVIARRPGTPEELESSGALDALFAKMTPARSS
jgi:hypothetical protein